MSGVVGIAHSGGKPVSRELLERMTFSLSFRGPDSQRVWLEGSVGLGHAVQPIAGETRSIGPESPGDGNWISADVRLDAREELVSALRARGKEAHLNFSDSQLLLAAYGTWGERCLEHVLGDFAFILWDTSRKQLLCACDHFGVRRLYFAHLGSLFLCSNTLDCVRLHPEVSARLNETAVADFLLFGTNQNPDTTTFVDIHRLPRGHFLLWSPSSIEIVQYWRPPANGEIRYKNRNEYVEHFDELFRKAIADRTRGDKVGILLSGGLDSSSVAAFCKEERDRRGFLDLHAFTMTTEASSDDDGQAAQIVAKALNIPLHRTFADQISAFEGWDSISWPEPIDDPLAVGMVKQFAQIREHVPVILSGEGSDNLMEFEPWPHLRDSWREGDRIRAVRDIAEHIAARFWAPDGLRGPLHGMVRWISDRADGKTQFPEWLNSEFATRLNLRERWPNPDGYIPWHSHAHHPRAYASLFFPEWSYMFEREDPAFTKSAVVVRYPFLDVRIVNYLLAIPTMPWFFRKFLLRQVVRGRLPQNIRTRAKRSGERKDPLVPAIQNCVAALRENKFSDETRRYVDAKALGTVDWTHDSSERIVMKIRSWCLDRWLKQLSRSEEVGKRTQVSMAT